MDDREWENKFWAKVDMSGECWEWTACCDRDGYGKLARNKEYWYAHRMAYVLKCGDIPEGALVCHTCDNPGCVNPSHLFLGTPLENMRDKVRKGRQTRGSKHYTSKLHEDDVLAIRGLIKRGWFTQESIANIFGVCKQTITLIKQERGWDHVSR